MNWDMYDLYRLMKFKHPLLYWKLEITKTSIQRDYTVEQLQLIDQRCCMLDVFLCLSDHFSDISLSNIRLVRIWDLYRNLIHEFNVFSFYRTFSVLLGFNKLKFSWFMREFLKNCQSFFSYRIIFKSKVTIFFFFFLPFRWIR